MTVMTVKEEGEDTKVLEQEVAEGIVGGGIEYPTGNYYETHYMPQTANEIHTDKEKKILNF